MEIHELKKMLEGSTAVLIMDNGEPSFVVVNYRDYRVLLNKSSETEIPVHNDLSTPVRPMNPGPHILAQDPAGAATDLELLERINKDILALKEQIEQEEKELGI